jgi:hypothetical protein
MTGTLTQSIVHTASALALTPVATLTDTGTVNEVATLSGTLTEGNQVATVSVTPNPAGLLVGGSDTETVIVTLPGTAVATNVFTGSVTATVNGVTETLPLTVTAS